VVAAPVALELSMRRAAAFYMDGCAGGVAGGVVSVGAGVAVVGLGAAVSAGAGATGPEGFGARVDGGTGIAVDGAVGGGGVEGVAGAVVTGAGVVGTATAGGGIAVVEWGFERTFSGWGIPYACP
jgi:hypothetical protein